MARTPKVVEDRREQIIDAAMNIFAQKGFSRATNKDIAREAGITPGLIYHYFENKEALLKAIIEERSPLQLMRSIPPHMWSLPATTFLPSLLMQILEIVENERFIQLIRVFLPEIIHNPGISTQGVTIFQTVINFMESYLAKKMEGGELRQAHAALTAQCIIGSVMGFVLRRQILRDPLALQYTHKQIADTIVTTALQGLLPR